MRGCPVPVGVGDLVVNPGKRPDGCPVHEGSGFPAESEPLILEFLGSGQLRPMTLELVGVAVARDRAKTAGRISGMNPFGPSDSDDSSLSNTTSSLPSSQSKSRKP